MPRIDKVPRRPARSAGTRKGVAPGTRDQRSGNHCGMCAYGDPRPPASEVAGVVSRREGCGRTGAATAGMCRNRRASRVSEITRSYRCPQSSSSGSRTAGP
jgi:hypothetical protein